MKIVTTADGSPTVLNGELNEHYHSLHGAMQESLHVFIEAGLKACKNNPLKILELGFGTGLNAWLTWKNGEQKIIHYYSVEKYPISYEIAQEFGNALKCGEDFLKIHESPWESVHELSSTFSLNKIEGDFLQVALPKGVDLVFFDAFSPGKQPELWTVEVFKRILDICSEKAVLVTYCCKGLVRRNLMEAGWNVEKIPGPPGKREMLRACKG